jgi:uncharacterized protein (DUF2126 family)
MFLRDETLYLLPGDSPMGYRLPLDSLPWVKDQEYPWMIAPDPTASQPPLPAHSSALRHQPRAGVDRLDSTAEDAATTAGNAASSDNTTEKSRTPAPQESASWIIRTALCVEPRNGRLHVFLPPVPTTGDFLELVAAIEQTAASLQIPVILEGTPPSFDHRLQVLKVTPDPGVIEVNLQPAASWDELVDNTTTLYEEARECRLATEKFMIDGRHCGTGGGNHIIIGGETPSDSPLFRDLQRALKARGLFPGAVTGVEDAATREATRRFQAARGLDSGTLSLAAARELGIVAAPTQRR